jgi:hypothetical protein
MILYIYADTDATGSFYNNEMFVWPLWHAVSNTQEGPNRRESSRAWVCVV